MVWECGDLPSAVLASFSHAQWDGLPPAPRVASPRPRSEWISVGITATPSSRFNLGRGGDALRAALCRFYIQRAE